jgi:ribonuclease G
MPNEIVINASAGETRVALLERGTFNELHIERESDRSVGGMVVLGRVTRVLPGMQAAFVDIGLEKAAFLYVGDYFDDSAPSDAESDDEEDAPRPRRPRGRNAQRQPPPNIEGLLKEGQEIVVQVAKEPIGTKGARITSHLSIAGRHLVLTPWARRVGVSRRIDSDRERRRLREIVTRVKPPDLGFIIRTAGEGAREADLAADVKYLTSVWDDIQFRKESAAAPAPLYSELSLPLRVIRDFANSKTKKITIDNAKVYEDMKRFLSDFVADPKPVLDHFQGAEPIFDHFRIESTIDDNLGKKVWLKSGGYLIIDQSEALTAIDVNTGRYVGKRDLEETVLKTNLEAVKEVVSQLRFRNIGGLIIIDLIDMETAANREKVYRELQDALRQDKSKTNILKISELGLVEMTRKRTRENLVQMLCEPCGYCEGRGYVLSSESVAYKVLREIRKDLPRFCGRQIAVTVSPRVAEVLLGRARRAQAELSEELGREIEIRARPGLHQEQFEVVALDSGPPVSLSLAWLEESKPEPEAPASPEADDAGADAPDEATAAVAVPAEPDTALPEAAAPELAAPEAAESEGAEPLAESPAIPEPAPVAEVAAAEGEAAEPEPAPQDEEREPRATWAPATAEAPDPQGGHEPEEPVSGGEHPRPAAERIALAAAPFAEMLDVEAESPILPDSDEREES